MQSAEGSDEFANARELADAAWGGAPGRWPLPPATEPRARWHRAVALGGQGRYSAARAELDSAAPEAYPDSVVRSLMASTRASWSRQTGDHLTAAKYDGEAIAMVGLAVSDGRRSAIEGLQALQARCDALTGLAADALGVGRFRTSDALLGRCTRVLDLETGSGELWRQRLRLEWVRAELAMASGEGFEALRHARAALELADETVSLRHRIKTDLIVAAAHCSVGDVGRSRTITHGVLDACSEHGLVPLRWAAAMLWKGLGEADSAPSVIDECTQQLARRGGVLAGA